MKQEKNIKKAVISFALFACMISASTVFALSAWTQQYIMASYGLVKTIGLEAYWDKNCTNLVSSINWGMVAPNSSETMLIYLKNEGTTPVTFSLNVTNWNPPQASKFISLTWNYTGAVAARNQCIPVNLNLIVASNITGITDFNFQIVIVATES